MTEQLPSLLAELLSGFFAVSATAKLVGWRSFCQNLITLELMPQRFTAPTASAVVSAEFVLASMLIAGPLRLSLALSAGWFLLMAMAIALAVSRGAGGRTCGCLGDLAASRATYQKAILEFTLATFIGAAAALVHQPIRGASLVTAAAASVLFVAAFSTLSALREAAGHRQEFSGARASTRPST